ncbi:MFS general substrate transporter [Basidiobolus meristosporus CBS 931.73]|uniref:MFS general substrate transporter n=1 Tax=Basidiobolus meristosporus CBS 931.73 TaxID=1314790 RepID=A0A1Y1YFC0_9FUNG|nr:MFS general substrate transporter [Basidiobolus meristosporus CBS 931.73]|eukprot:ORX96699.1 MFS general substrate transporter [Basidiobolus meristosporus CBS 931.73]
MRCDNPLSQVMILGLICCFVVGVYNVYYGIGTLGKMSASDSRRVNIALYATCAVCSTFAGSINNLLGPRISLILAGLTYILYVFILWAFTRIANAALTIVGAVIVGFGSALLWATVGMIITSYPTENQKGRFFGIFWILFNIGAFVGGFLPLLDFNFQVVTISFISLMVCGLFLILFLIPSAQVIREDGSRVTSKTGFRLSHELRQLLRAITNRKLLLLWPIFLYSNWFYSYRFGDLNVTFFTPRTRTFNNIFYWASQMLGAFTFGQFLDNPLMCRSKRATLGLGFIFLFFTASWLGCLVVEIKDFMDVDVLDDQYARFLVLFLLSGFSDAMIQTWCYWIIGTLTNNAMILSRYSGIYKAIQSAGTAISWYLDATSVAPTAVVGINWALLYIGTIFAYMIARKVSDTNYSFRESIRSPPETYNQSQES